MELYVHVQNMLTNASMNSIDVHIFWVKQMPFGLNELLRKHYGVHFALHTVHPVKLSHQQPPFKNLPIMPTH